MTHYPFPDSRGTKIAFAAFFTAMLFLARDSICLLYTSDAADD